MDVSHGPRIIGDRPGRVKGGTGGQASPQVSAHRLSPAGANRSGARTGPSRLPVLPGGKPDETAHDGPGMVFSR